MLGTAMASSADGCLSEKRDPCASPPCKRLKQAALPVECIILEDSNEATTTNPLTNQSSTTTPNNLQQNHINESQPLANNEQNKEHCVETENSSLMEIECSSEEGTKSETQADPPLPCMDGLPETNSDVENSNCVNGSPLNSIKNGQPNGSKNGQPSPEPAKNGLPSSQSPKGSGTLFSFFSPVTPSSKTTTVEHSKTPSKDDARTPSKDDGKTPSKDDGRTPSTDDGRTPSTDDGRTPSKDDGRTPSKDSGYVVGSPCTPVNTKTSPDGSANGETPNPGTVPSSGMKTTTPRRNTPGRKLSVEEKLKREEERVRKQKEKEALEQERLEKKKEKERLKEEKQKERIEAKEKKDQEKLEQLEQRKQREKERIEKKEQEEKERKEKLEKKEEEKRKREEEKKKREDEKNLKNEEKRKKEEEETLKKQKVKNSFASFFIKKEVAATPKAKEQVPKEAKFQPFELKPFMKLSSTPYRKPLSQDDKQLLSEHLVEQATASLHQVKEELLALRELARKIKLEANESKTNSATERDEDEIMVIDDDLPSDLKTTEPTTKHEINKVKGKLLQFRENNRPAYFGSWRKKSSSVGPRTPLKKDEDLLNYDVDSDDEWEEEEPGESLSNSEGEDEEEGCPNDDDEEQDGFFVPHGYLSDDEGDQNDEEDRMEHDGGGSEKFSQNNPEDKMERHLAKQKTWEAELKRQFKPMKPIAIGCIWDGQMPAILKQLEACCLLAEGSIDPTYTKKEYQEHVTSSPSTTSHCSTAMPVPEEAMPFLIKTIHGSEAGLKKLLRLFRKRWTLATKTEDGQVSEENWESHCTISKRQVERKITSIANKELRSLMPKPRWYVHSSILAFYKLENIPLPMNGLVTANSKEKSPSPVPLQTKSPIITSFTNVKVSSEKINEVRTQEIAQKSTVENTEVTSMDITPPVRLG